jgi:type VI secretion system protein
MALVLEIVSKQRTVLGKRARFEFGEKGGTIGRSLSCDWVLPDPERFVSSRHAAIDFRSGSYYLVDTSTNGVFVNDATTPVGRSKPQRLFHGDRLRIGDYLVVARMTGEDSLDIDDARPDPVELAQSVSAPDEAPSTMVSPFEMTGPVDLKLALEDDHLRTQPVDITQRGLPEAPAARPHTDRKPAAAKRPAPAQPAPPAKKKPEARKGAPAPAGKSGLKVVEGHAGARAAASEPAAKAPARPAPRAAAPAANEAEAVAAFLQAAGLDPAELGHLELTPLMRSLGQMLREVVVGMTDVLHARSEQKARLKVGTTTIQRTDNNPLKFSAGVAEALNRLLQPRGTEYMPPVEAIREAFADVKGHQTALVAAMHEAFGDFTDHLDPSELESRFERTLKRKSILSGNQNARYWELYGELYQVMMQAPPGQLPHVFTEEFTRAYEAALAEDRSRQRRA